MASAAVVAATFAATPFLLPDVATRLSLDIGRTGLLSTAQVGSSALASFLAGRLFRPTRRLHYGSLALIALATLGSAAASDFTILLVTRLLTGLGLGTLTWIAWSDATRFPRGLGDVAAIAPLTAAIASPGLGWLIEAGGCPMVFVALAILSLTAIAFPVGLGELPRVGRTVSGSRSNRLLLMALLILTLGGSSVFIFTGASGIEIQGLSPTTIAWAFSLNAIAGVVATRREPRTGRAGLWLTGTAVSALAIGLVTSGWVFFVAMAIWGYSFWMGVPAVFRLLVARSLTAAERVGDAQAAMAVGRVFGPVVGGLALGAGRFTRLSLIGAGIMATAALSVLTVERYRHSAATAWGE
jgi:predicted MFS family arabinose efflux permease